MFGLFDILVVILFVILFVVSKLDKLKKLTILRLSLIIALTVAQYIPEKLFSGISKLKLPMKWLRHYLIGSGTNLVVPEETVKEASAAIMQAMLNTAGGYNNDLPNAGCEDPFDKDFCLYHSTLYAGRGFYNRPTMFYLVGGFTFHVNNNLTVSGSDVYDWHPTAEGKYFTSPLGEGEFTKIAMAILDKVFGNDWFVANGFPSGEAGVSNKLWDDLHLAGAHEFTSTFSNVDCGLKESRIFAALWRLAVDNETVLTIEEIRGFIESPLEIETIRKFVIDDYEQHLIDPMNDSYFVVAENDYDNNREIKHLVSVETGDFYRLIRNY